MNNLFSKVTAVNSNVISRSLASSTTTASFPVKAFKLHKLDKGPNIEVELSREDGLTYYKQMQMIRRLETAAGNLYKEKKIRGFCHLYTGQEAVAVGIKAAMHTDDAVITAYRCHGWVYLMGATVKSVLAELTGNVNGNVYGKGGSMHMYERNFYGGNGIVGAQQSLGTGVAFAMKYNKKPNICMTLYGDGASNQGQLFESANMAALWNLPCIYICENNGYGMGTSAERSSASSEYYTRGDYVPGIHVDGMDLLAVREAIKFCKEYANAGNGPLFLEMATYRYTGHSMSDPGTSYRTRDEIQNVRKTRDAISLFKDRLITSGLAHEDDLKQIDKDVRKHVEDAVQVAVNGEIVPLEALYTDIYVNSEPQFVRGTQYETSKVQEYGTTDELLTAHGIPLVKYGQSQ